MGRFTPKIWLHISAQGMLPGSTSHLMTAIFLPYLKRCLETLDSSEQPDFPFISFSSKFRQRGRGSASRRQPRIKAPKPPLLPSRVQPEAKEIGPTNRKLVLTLPAGCAGAGGEGRERRGARGRKSAKSAPPHRTARGAQCPYSDLARDCRGGCGLEGLKAKPAPRAAAVRNRVVTIVIALLFLMTMITIIYLLFLVTPFLTRMSRVGLAFFNAPLGRSRSRCWFCSAPEKRTLFSFSFLNANCFVFLIL